MAGELNIKGLKRRDDLMEVVDESPFTELQLVASKVLPEAPVKRASAQVPVKPVGNGKKVEDTRRATGGGFNRGSWKLDERSYITAVKGFEEGYDTIDDTVVQTEINLDQDNECAILARNTVLIARESRVASKVYDTAVFTGADYNLTPATKWDNAADIKADIVAGANKIKARFGVSQRQLSLTLNPTTIDIILDQTSVKESIKYVSDSGVPMELMTQEAQVAFLAKYLRVGEIIVVESLADSNDLGVDGSDFVDLWNPAYAMLAYTSKTPSFRSAGLGVQPVFTPYAADIRFDEYDNKATSQHIIRASEYRGEYINKEFGFLFTDILS